MSEGRIGGEPGAGGLTRADDRDVLFAVALQRMACEDVAVVQGCAVDTAEDRLFHARRQPRARLAVGAFAMESAGGHAPPARGEAPTSGPRQGPWTAWSPP